VVVAAEEKAEGAAKKPEEAVAASSAARVPTLLERLDQYSAGDPPSDLHIAAFPPDYVAAPCKPILFDLAHSDRQYPNVSARFAAAAPAAAPASAASAGLAAKPDDKAAKAGGGWLGFFRR
jgi:hypothetical protein